MNVTINNTKHSCCNCTNSTDGGDKDDEGNEEDNRGLYVDPVAPKVC